MKKPIMGMYTKQKLVPTETIKALTGNGLLIFI